MGGADFRLLTVVSEKYIIEIDLRADALGTLKSLDIDHVPVFDEILFRASLYNCDFCHKFKKNLEPGRRLPGSPKPFRTRLLARAHPRKPPPVPRYKRDQISRTPQSLSLAVQYSKYLVKTQLFE